MKVIAKIIIIMTISFSSTYVQSANTVDWECLGDIAVPFVAPTKESIKNISDSIITFRFNNQPRTVKYSNNDNLLTVKFKKPVSDVKSIGIGYNKVSDGYAYIIIYEYTSNAVALLDILNRYGAEVMDIKTDSDLSKSIEILLKSNTLINYDFKYPLYNMPLFIGKNDFISLKFISKDKVFVDTMVFAYFKKTTEAKINLEK